MPQPFGRHFSVGRNKASPARTASTRRASIRKSVISSDGPKLDLDFECAGESSLREDPLEAMPENDAPSASPRDSWQTSREGDPTDMKDTPLPPLPVDMASHPRASATLPHPSPKGRPPQQPTSSRMSQSRPLRASQNSTTMAPPSRPPSKQQNIFRRLTSKFRSSHAPSQPPPTPHLRPSRDEASPRDPSQRKSAILRLPKAPLPATLPTDFTSMEQRQAALRARGLIPASTAAPRRFRGQDGYMMPLSEQEAEIDRRFTIVMPGDSSTDDESASEAKKIREAWLSKQAEASASPSLSERDNPDDMQNDKAESLAAELSPPPESDAAERASRDGTLGDRSPVRATFVVVDAPTLSSNAAEVGTSARIASPFEGSEDFHTPPDSPALLDGFKSLPPFEQDAFSRASSPSHRKPPPASTSASTPPDDGPARSKEQRDPPDSPSAHSSAKVSRWLRTSSDMPTPLSGSPIVIASDPVLTASPRSSLDEPLPPSAFKVGTVRARKEKPPPIVITSDGKPSIRTQMPSDSEASTSESSHSRPSLSITPSTRGRPVRLAHAPSTYSRTTAGTIPALSPTRTVSSGADSALPTPTTVSCGGGGALPLVRDVSISRGSTSHSSENGHDSLTGKGIPRSRRGTGPALLIDGSKTKARGPGAAAVILEEYSETEPSSDGGEFGMGNPAPAVTRPRPSQEVAGAVPRPARAQTLEQGAEKAQNRKSFSLFGKKSVDVPRAARTSSSMLNLRRAFTSATKPRPQSTLEVAPEQARGMSKKRQKMFDASHLPPSPTAPSGFPGATLTNTAPRPRPPRQAVSPTMHNHGTIVLQTNFIEDEESRRLSEMAFLT